MTDKNGKPIEAGVTIQDEQGVEYKVTHGNFDKSIYGEGPDLIADAGYVKSLLWPERAKIFEVISR